MPRTSDTTPPALARGVYRHYKGAHYHVLDLVRHSETEEWLVYYRTCYGDWSRWVRPYDMFIEQVVMANVKQPRFDYVAAELAELNLIEPESCR